MAWQRLRGERASNADRPTTTHSASVRLATECGKLCQKMNAEWAIHYFDPQTGRETESRRLSSLEEAVSLAETFERQGCSVRFLASPHGKMNWPLSKRKALQ
jgi:hypothetical protein